MELWHGSEHPETAEALATSPSCSRGSATSTSHVEISNERSPLTGRIGETPSTPRSRGPSRTLGNVQQQLGELEEAREESPTGPPIFEARCTGKSIQRSLTRRGAHQPGAVQEQLGDLTRLA